MKLTKEQFVAMAIEDLPKYKAKKRKAKEREFDGYISIAVYKAKTRSRLPVYR